MSDAGVIIERAHEWTVLRSVEEVFFSKVSGEKPLEIFEKSIDKHKIDAILDAPSRTGGRYSLLVGVAYMPEDSTEESGSHPDTRITPRTSEDSHAYACGYEGGRVMRPDWGCSLKSVE